MRHVAPIVVGLDGSTTSAEALRRAARSRATATPQESGERVQARNAAMLVLGSSYSTSSRHASAEYLRTSCEASATCPLVVVTLGGAHGLSTVGAAAGKGASSPDGAVDA
jgi:hypothetical protein